MALQMFENRPAEPELSGEKGPDPYANAMGLLTVTVILVSLGLTMLYSASFVLSGINFFKKQLIWIVGGILAGTAVFMTGYRRLSKYRGLFLFICWAMLVGALFFSPVNGARRWIRFVLPALGEVSIQPSELTKIALCLFVAGYCTDFARSFTLLKHWRGIVPLAFYVVVTGGLVWAGKDMGTCLLILTSAGLIMLAAGLYLRYFFLGAAAAGAYFGAHVLSDPERFSRIATISDPSKDGLGAGYQLYRSLMALGSGGWFGLGYGNSVRKYTQFPAANTDFILAIVVEEMGIMGFLIIFIPYMIFYFINFL